MYYGVQVPILSLYDLYLRIFVFHTWTQVQRDHGGPGQGIGKAGIKGVTARQPQFDMFRATG
jgi:hypothetical protein